MSYYSTLNVLHSLYKRGQENKLNISYTVGFFGLLLHVFWLNNRVTTRLIFMNFDWFKNICSQSNVNNINPVVIRFLNQNASIIRLNNSAFVNQINHGNKVIHFM